MGNTGADKGADVKASDYKAADPSHGEADPKLVPFDGMSSLLFSLLNALLNRRAGTYARFITIN